MEAAHLCYLSYAGGSVLHVNRVSICFPRMTGTVELTSDL